MTTDDTPVLYRRDGRAAVLTLNRPDRLNAVSLQLYEILLGHMDTAEGDPEVRAIVITGQGRGFCVGADLKAHGETPLGDTARRRYIDAAQAANTRIQTSPLPVIAGVNGHAIGAGLELALSADFVLVAEEAKLRLPEVALGTFIGGGVTYTLSRRVGDLKARELILGADFFSGAEAARIGLANRALPADQILPASLELAERLAGHAPISLSRAKALLNEAHEATPEVMLEAEAEALAEIMKTDDWAEGVRAFAEKRTPNYEGR